MATMSISPEGSRRFMAGHAIYAGKFSCPRCGSPETGTNTIATSCRWIWFRCARGHRFKKASVGVSPASAGLRGAAKVLNSILREGE
jgi:hypothetical protein